MKKVERKLKRVNINLPENIVDSVKRYADSLGINVTSAYIVLLNQALSQEVAMNNLPQLLQAYKKFDELGLIDNMQDNNDKVD